MIKLGLQMLALATVCNPRTALRKKRKSQNFISRITGETSETLASQFDRGDTISAAFVLFVISAKSTSPLRNTPRLLKLITAVGSPPGAV